MLSIAASEREPDDTRQPLNNSTLVRMEIGKVNVFDSLLPRFVLASTVWPE